MKLLKADDGVSESLGFILLALILILAIAMVLMIGYPMYQKSIGDAHMQNMQEGFYLLAANMNKVALYESPTQSSELKLYGGVMSIHDDGDFKIYYDDGTGEKGPFIIDPHHQVLEYRLGNEKVAYVLGGVFEKSGSNSVLLKDPIAYEHKSGSLSTTVIPLIIYSSTTNAISNLELGSSSNSLVRIVVKSPFYLKSMNTISYNKAERIPDVKNIRIVTTSEYKDAISQYFTEDLGFTPSINGDELTLTKNYGTESTTLYIPYCILTVSIN